MKLNRRKFRFLVAGMLLLSLGAKAQSKEYTIAYEGHKLYGILCKPKVAEEHTKECCTTHNNNKAKKQGIVILSHGFGGTHHFGYAYVEMLNRLGYQIYFFDYAHGSPRSRSDKNTMQMSVLDMQSQLEAIVEHFRKQPDIDPRRIVLLGESQGGLISALAAAKLKNKVERLVLVYPAFCIPYHWRAHYPTLESIQDTTRLWQVPMGRQYFEEIHSMDAFALAKEYKQPVLIVHGDKDPIVPYADSERMQKLYRKATLHCIPGAGHGFNTEQFQQNLSYIEEFLKE